MFSKACEYGLKAIIYIATQSIDNKRVKINDVAENTDTPVAFTAKILGTLTKHKIVKSMTGPKGGFEIDLEVMNKTKISDIVYIIDGDNIYNGCALGLAECNAEEPCPLHYKFSDVRAKLKEMLETTTIFDLATKLKSGETMLIR